VLPPPADRPPVVRLGRDPLAVARLEKLRIALTGQISRYGWRTIMTALQAACEHAAQHQRDNAPAVALWQWRAQRLGQLARTEQPPTETAGPRATKKKRR